MAEAQRLIFATRNEGKVREMTDLLADSPWKADRLPAEVGDYEETGSTFEENARGKALFASLRLEEPVLADDSGLEIDALGGEPGVRSARYIDEALTQQERNAAVLEKLRDVSAEQRTARFVCHLVLAHNGHVVHEAVGVCEGIIASAPRGRCGFGYDPLFLVPELGLTFAEIDRDAKSARSHRGTAAREMARFLQTWRPGDTSTSPTEPI